MQSSVFYACVVCMLLHVGSCGLEYMHSAYLTDTHSKYNTYLHDNKATGGCASLEGEEGVMHACLLRMSLRAKREVKSLGRTRFVVSLAIRGSMHGRPYCTPSYLSLLSPAPAPPPASNPRQQQQPQQPVQ